MHARCSVQLSRLVSALNELNRNSNTEWNYVSQNKWRQESEQQQQQKSMCFNFKRIV